MDLHREIKALQAELREIRALQQQQEIRALQQQQHHRVQTLQARKAREQQQTQVANAHKFAQDDVTFGVSIVVLCQSAQLHEHLETSDQIPLWQHPDDRYCYFASLPLYHFGCP